MYHLTEGLQQWHVRRMVRAALDGYAELLEEAFTEEFLAPTISSRWLRLCPRSIFPRARSR